MKKLVSILVLLCFTLSLVLSGCGTSADQSAEQDTKTTEQKTEAAKTEPTKTAEAVTVTFLSWANETQAKPLIDGFTAKNPNIKIDFSFAPPVKEYIEKLRTMIASDAAPDIFQMALENREDLIKGNYCEDLSAESYMKDGTIPDTAKNTYGSDGKVYSVAVDAWAGGLFYNKKMFAKAGITSEPQTWQEFLDDCKKLKDAGMKPIIDNCQEMAANVLPALFAAQTLQKNPKFHEEVYAGTKKLSDGWTEPMKLWYEGLVKPGYITKDMLGIQDDQEIKEFATEKYAMMPGGPWRISQFKEINPDIDIKLMGIPGTDRGNIWYDGAVGVGFCVSSKSKVKDAAKKYLEFLTNSEGLTAYQKGYGGTIIAKGFTNQVDPIMADGVNNGLMVNKFFIPMGEWTSYTEALRSQYVTSLQDLVVGKITTAEDFGKSLDKKFEEMKKN